MSLPIYKTEDKDFTLMQTGWAQQINPLVTNPVLQGITLQNVALINGTTIINHKLGRKLQGWVLVRQRAAASVHDTQDANSMPNLTLSLVSSAAVVVDIYVF